MGFRFPFSNLSELNLDWVLSKVKEITDKVNSQLHDLTEIEEKVDNAVYSVEHMTVEANTLQPGEDATATKSIINGHINIDFGIPKGEQGEQGIPGQDGRDGQDATDAQVQAAVNTWLANNVDPDSGYVLDNTLTQPLAAAPADLVGGIKAGIAGEFNASHSYQVGSFVWYQGSLYCFVKYHAANTPWSASEVTITSLNASVRNSIYNVAPYFSESHSYTAGEYVVYYNMLFKFTSDHSAGAWDYSHVMSVHAMDEVTDLNGNINQLELTKAPIITDTALGSIATFPDGSDGLPVKNLTVNIEPVQTGSGDPSPDNIRPITGWTGANVTRCGFNLWDEEWEEGNIVSGENVPATGRIRSKNYITVVSGATYYCKCPATAYLNIFYYDANKNYLSQEPNSLRNTTFIIPANARFIRFGTYLYGATYNDDICINLSSSRNGEYEAYNGVTIVITFPGAAGTVYGGTLDVTSGKLTVTMLAENLGQLTWNYTTSYGRGVFYSNLPLAKTYPAGQGGTLLCDRYATIPSSTPSVIASTGNNLIAQTYNSTQLLVTNDTYSDTVSFKTAMSGVNVYYELATPVEYTLTPEQLTTLLGTNNIWADTGDVSVDYRANTKLYIDKVLNA